MFSPQLEAPLLAFPSDLTNGIAQDAALYFPSKQWNLRDPIIGCWVASEAVGVNHFVITETMMAM